jgi:hypothetical protein
LVDRLAVEQRHEDAHLPELTRRHFEPVLLEDEEIGALAQLDRAGLLLQAAAPVRRRSAGGPGGAARARKRKPIASMEPSYYHREAVLA